MVVLIGGSTGRDGIGGSQFASDSLEGEDRSAVQIPDPFIEKLIIETILEARNEKCINAMKDLGGGGLSCAVSEIAESLEIGIELDVNNVHTRESGLLPDEIMISESQERMLVITSKQKLPKLRQICNKFRVTCSTIGHVKNDKMMHVKKHWVFQQYDHEVGIRTVVKPGFDASVLRLDNGKFLSAKIDGNPKHCYLDPRQGAIGCFEEACRNVVCTGANPIGMVDHLQFGNPEDPEIFWTFMESLEGLTEYAKFLSIPCVGGKVSFYNETPSGPIKPTPLIGVLGIKDKTPFLSVSPNNDDYLVVIGDTKDELGGSEYFEYIHRFIGGVCPRVDFTDSKINMLAVLSLIKNKLVKSVHDCSKGGLSIALSELSIFGNIGCIIDIEKIPCEENLSSEKILFSESHSRYLLVIDKKNIEEVNHILSKKKITFAVLGKFSGDQINIKHKSKNLVKFRTDLAQKRYFNGLEDLLKHG